MENVITQENMTAALNFCYEKAISGDIPGAKNCQYTAKHYTDKYESIEIAAQKFIKSQIAICTTSGFVTNLGGGFTLAAGIPANIISVLYTQIRMIATLASMGGYDVNNDEVRTLIYLCLTGGSIGETCKAAGVQIANKTATVAIKKIPGSILTKINQRVGFRLVTKFGTKGAINLVKLVPVAGGIVGGTMDFAGTKIIGAKAYDVFIKGDIK